MASVYKAYDTRLEREVALKVILQTRQQSPKFLMRFEREAKALAQLSHPNIVKVLDFGEHEGLPYLVMEFTPAGTLKDRLGESLPWREAAGLLAPVGRALEYAHGQKIVHRDVKPSNILITASGEPMLSDFGIAKVLEAEETWDLTGTGVGIGTPEYMAPEQGMGKPVDHRADIYALGIAFYEMVTGRKPFQADTPLATLLKQVHDPLPRPKEFVPQLPSNVEQVIFKALAKRPDDRFQETGAFALALEELARGEKVTVAGLPRLALSNLLRRLSPYSSLAGILVVAVAVIAALALFLRRDLPAAELNSTLALALATEIAETALAGQGATATQKALENHSTGTQRVADRNLTATIVALTPSRTPTMSPTTTPTPTKAYTDGPILFEDDFEDGDSNDWRIGTLGWEVLQDETGNYLLRGSMEPDPVSNDAIQIGAGSTTWQDYAFEFRARVVEGEAESLNARIRHNDEILGGCRAYRLILGGAEVSLIRAGYGEPICEIRLDRHPTTLGDGAWHVVRMEAFGTEVAVYIDEELLLYVDDPEPVENGRIQFEVRQGSAVDFDDVRVVELIRNDPTGFTSATPLARATDEPGLPLYDDFEDPAFDGTINYSLWTTSGGCDGVAQEAGAMVFRNRNDTCDLVATDPSHATASELGALEAMALVSSDHNGETVTQEIYFRTNDLPGGFWFAACGLRAGASGMETFFEVMNAGAQGPMEISNKIPAEYDRWYQLRLELDDETMQFTCFVDQRSLGSLLPNDSLALAEVQFDRRIEAVRWQGGYATTYVDDVKVGAIGD